MVRLRSFEGRMLDVESVSFEEQKNHIEEPFWLIRWHNGAASGMLYYSYSKEAAELEYDRLKQLFGGGT